MRLSQVLARHWWVGLAGGWWLSGCAHFAPAPLPGAEVRDYPARVEREGVTVAAYAMGRTYTRTVFDADLVRQGAQPLMLLIGNHGPETYLFRKADVDDQYLPATEVARHAERYSVAESIVGTVFWLLPDALAGIVMLPIYPVVALAEMNASVNEQISLEYQTREISDAQIDPSRSLSGVIFLRPERLREQVTIRLTNLRTQRPLVFKMPPEVSAGR